MADPPGVTRFGENNYFRIRPRLWGHYDPRKGPLDTTVVREWKDGLVTCRYVVFTIGTFKGTR